ncbi:MAG: SMP-30/gluconolactonase/LRE family protein [Spirochaetia bacterium]
MTVQPVIAMPGCFEGVAAAESGDIYTSDQVTCGIFHVRPDETITLLADIYEKPNPNTDVGTVGMAVSKNGDVWVIFLTWDPATHGVWRITPDGKAKLAVPLSPTEVIVPNGLVFDPEGNLYITESHAGSIWKASRDGSAKLWLQHEMLAPPEGHDYGANGIDYRDGALYVANTDQGTVVRVPVNMDGSPGKPSILAKGIIGADGLAFDKSGTLYIVNAYASQLVRLTTLGKIEVVVDKGLDHPASIAFGKSPVGMVKAYITNFGEYTTNERPNLVRVDLPALPSRD